MGESALHPKTLSEDEQARLNEIVWRFEAAWQAHPAEPPDLVSFLPSEEPLGFAVLAALARIDLEMRRKTGKEIRQVEDYLRLFPQLATDSAVVLTLISVEYEQRRRQVNVPLEDYLGRFPQYREALTALARAATPWPGLNGYEVVEVIGRGGMGVVYKARQRGLNRLVAIKMLLAGAHADDGLRMRFSREAEAVAQLQHANIVQIHEVGEQDGHLFFAMEFVEGGSLAHKLNGTPLPPPEAAQLVETLALAMDYAHQRGIIHRDLKPANILLQAPQAQGLQSLGLDRLQSLGLGIPKIADFGLAKQVEGEAGQTCSGAILGTPSYMAPEQAAGQSKNIGPATDVYALGAILYEMLTGRPPFRGTTVPETLEQVRTQEPVPPRRLQPKLHRDLETICLKSLQKEPSRRYPSAAALAEDLRRFQAGEPIRARPVGPVERLGRWGRRNPVVAGLAAAVALLLLAGTAISSYFAIQANDRAREIEQQRDALQKEKDRADENFALARTATDEMSTRISQDPRLRQHDLEGLRKDLLQSAVRIYEKLVQSRGRDEGLQLEQGRTLGRLARMTVEIQSKAESVPLFRQALDIFENLARAHPEVPEYQKYEAITHLNLGHVYGELSRRPDAEQSYLKAQAIWENLGRADPANREHQVFLATVQGALANCYSNTDRPALAEKAYLKTLQLSEALAHTDRSDPGQQNRLAMDCNNLGAFYRETDRQEEAEKLYQKAFQIRDRLARADPNEPDLQVNLAMSYSNLGNLYRATDRRRDADESYHKALEIQERLVRTHPLVTSYRADLAESYARLGGLYSDAGRWDDAEKVYFKALAIWEELARTDASVPGHTAHVGEITCDLGGLLLARGNHPVALDWFDRSIRTLQAVLQKDKENADAREYLSEACDGRAQTLTRLGRLAEARKDWAQALDLAPGPAQARLRLAPAHTLAQLGAHAQATAEAQTLVANGPVAGDLLYQAACVHALALAAVRNDAKLSPAEREPCANQYPARAVELLRQAQAAGYFKAPAHMRRLKKDKDLDPLRSREDFQKLLREVESPGTKPEAR